eukprot:356058-Chlamydomonas_euryale.AAC.1
MGGARGCERQNGRRLRLRVTEWVTLEAESDRAVAAELFPGRDQMNTSVLRPGCLQRPGCVWRPDCTQPPHCTRRRCGHRLHAATTLHATE